jgi:hypothetical protein
MAGNCRAHGGEKQEKKNIVKLLDGKRSLDGKTYLLIFNVQHEDDRVAVQPCPVSRCWPSPSQQFLISYPVGTMAIFLFSPDSYVFRNGTSSSARGGIAQLNCC